MWCDVVPFWGFRCWNIQIFTFLRVSMCSPSSPPTFALSSSELSTELTCPAHHSCLGGSVNSFIGSLLLSLFFLSSFHFQTVFNFKHLSWPARLTIPTWGVQSIHLSVHFYFHFSFYHPFTFKLFSTSNIWADLPGSPFPPGGFGQFFYLFTFSFTFISIIFSLSKCIQS